jgi:hypothetical protein
MEIVETSLCKLWLPLYRGQWFKILYSVLMLELYKYDESYSSRQRTVPQIINIFILTCLYFPWKEFLNCVALHNSLHSTRSIDFEVNPSWSKSSPLFMYSAISTGSHLTMPQTRFRQLWKRWLVATCELWTGI